MPTLDYLLGEITVDNPHGDRDRALEANPGMLWPEEHWAVSDEQLGYLAFFRFEEDAWSFRLYIANLRQNGAVAAKRYAKADRRIDEDDRGNEWIVGTEASNGTFFMDNGGKPTKKLDEAWGFPHKKDAENYTQYFKKPRVFVRQRKDFR